MCRAGRGEQSAAMHNVRRVPLSDDVKN